MIMGVCLFFRSLAYNLSQCGFEKRLCCHVLSWSSFKPNLIDRINVDCDAFLELSPKADDLWFSSLLIKIG